MPEFEYADRRSVMTTAAANHLIPLWFRPPRPKHKPFPNQTTMHTLPLRRLAKYALLCAPLAVVACGDDDDVIPVIGDSPSEVLEDRDEFESLEEALDAEDLLATLDAQTALTLFAPTNAAFDAADLSGVTGDDLRNTLLYHAIGGAVLRSEDIPEGLRIFSPSDFSTPSLLVNNTGTSIMVNAATVVTPDIDTDNGVIHGIDRVLTLPTVVDLATYVPTLSTLVDAVTQAGLAEALSDTDGDGFTVFAPTDQGFAGTATDDLSEEQLGNVLRYHVVPGVVLAGSLTDGMTVETLQGEAFTVNVTGSGVTITDARGNVRNVTTTNVRGTNGVVHVIDGVLLPNDIN